MSRLLPPAAQGGVTLTAPLAEAVGYALETYGGQVRKGTSVPHVAHLPAVAALLPESGGDADEAVAALLARHLDAFDGPELPVPVESIASDLFGLLAEESPVSRLADRGRGVI